MDSTTLKTYQAKDLVILRAKPGERSDGDGQANDEISSQEIMKTPVKPSTPLGFTKKSNLPEVEKIAKQLSRVSLFTKPDSLLCREPHDISTKKKYLLRPKKIVQKLPIGSQPTKRKDPKFIPYEPYKACVKSIIPKNVPKFKNSASIAMNENTTITESDQLQVDTMITDFEEECSQYERENEELSKENDKLQKELGKVDREIGCLNQQLSTQLQVNTELKKLLVASVGEDVQGRVTCLTEDKARMATMIRKYSERVDKDYEEKERLSIESDVFRTKFKASSVLLEDLAKWKVTLVQKLDEAKEGIRLLMNERDVMHPLLVSIYRHVHEVQLAFDPLHSESAPSAILESADSVSLTLANARLADQVRDRLLGTIGRAFIHPEFKLPSETRTPGEKVAQQLVEDCTELINRTKAVPASVAQSALAQDFGRTSRHEKLTVNCCGHCNGEMHVV